MIVNGTLRCVAAMTPLQRGQTTVSVTVTETVVRTMSIPADRVAEAIAAASSSDAPNVWPETVYLKLDDATHGFRDLGYTEADDQIVDREVIYELD